MSSFTVTSDDSQPTTHNSSATHIDVNGTSGTTNGGVTTSRFKVSAAPWRPGGGTTTTSQQPSAFDAAALSTPLSGKMNLCPQIMSTGYCGEASLCGYAHTYDELDPSAQLNLQTLLSMSPAFSLHYGGGGSTRHRGPHQHFNGTHVLEGDNDFGGGPTPTSRRQLPHSGTTPTNRTTAQQKCTTTSLHNSSGTSSGGMCPPSPESHSSDISSVSSGAGAGGAPPAIGAAAGHPHQGAAAAGSNFGPTASPFIKNQMYYSQNANKVSLPERCRYPHATPGTYYDYLNVKRTATKTEIIAKYKQWRDDGYRKASTIDVERADAMDRLIVDSKTILSNDKLRQEYDLMLPPCQSSTPFAPAKSSSGTASPSSQPVSGPASPSFLQALPSTTGDSIW